jgi:hypothetical protein
MEYFVSGAGNDNNPGTRERPFRSVDKGVSVLVAGDVLNLRGGVHVGTVTIAGKHGTSDNPIVIRSAPGETAYIDGTLLQFRRGRSDDWVPARTLDSDAHAAEYVSAMTFTEDFVNRGAFLDRNPYTRLVTYSSLNDLRADNETFEKILDGGDPRPGPAVTDEDGNPLGYRHPWVYLGPGLHFNQQSRRVHIRLSHTHNNVPGVIEYTGETDPRRVPLAITPKDVTTLQISGSSHIRLEALTVRFGGDYTAVIQQSQHVTFDHVRIRAATNGIRMGGPAENPTSDVVFAHCEFIAGVPTWSFRSDRTGVYQFRDNHEVVVNNLGEKTSEALLIGSPNNTRVEIHHCEFHNGHNMFLHGRDVDFHHNWITNMQDDGLALGFDSATAGPLTTVKIRENVVQRVLTALSFSSQHQATQWYIYRNLFELRQPSRGFRPRRPGDRDVWRYGQLHTSAGQELGPHDLFHNTVLTFDQRGQASFLHYRNTTGPHGRRSFNNLFVAVNPGPEADAAIMFVPSPAFPGPTDGNLYHRIGRATAPAFRHLEYRFQGQDFPAGTFADLPALRGSALFEHSKTQYPPGYEANSLLTDPRFRRIDADGLPRETNDLRLAEDSPALEAGIQLPDDLGDLDPYRPGTGNPDIGCYRRDGEPLRVGVDGCHSVPKTPLLPPARPKRLAGGVWKPVFRHQFLDGDPANLQAVPGLLTVLPNGPVIDPTPPDPADRGMLMAPGNRLLTYQFGRPFDDVIGVDVSFDLLYPEPNPFTPAVFPLIALGAGGASAVNLSLCRLETPFPGLPPDALPAQVAFAVAGVGMAFDRVALPPFAAVQTTRFRARWHTNGQAHLWHEGVLRAYEPGLAAGSSITIDQLVIGIPNDVPRLFPRYRVRGVYLKLLRRNDAEHAVDRQVPLASSCQAPPAACMEQLRAVQGELTARTRQFMTGILAQLTTSWRDGQPHSPFSPEANAAHAAAVGAAREFGDFVERGGNADPGTYLQRIGEFFDVLAAADPAGFAALLTDLDQRAQAIDPACRTALEPIHNANAAALQPFASLLQHTWQRARTAQLGGSDA